MSTPYNPWRESLENCINGSNYLRASEYSALADHIDAQAIEIEFVRHLLWDAHPECCGQPVAGAEYMGSTEWVCCGAPQYDALNDAQIVASLRERFPEQANKSAQSEPDMPQAKHSPMVIAAARALCKRYADDCCVELEYAWNLYRDDHLADAQAAFDAAGVGELVEALQQVLAFAIVKYGNLDPEASAAFSKAGATLTRATGA